MGLARSLPGILLPTVVAADRRGCSLLEGRDESWLCPQAPSVCWVPAEPRLGFRPLESEAGRPQEKMRAGRSFDCILGLQAPGPWVELGTDTQVWTWKPYGIAFFYLWNLDELPLGKWGYLPRPCNAMATSMREGPVHAHLFPSLSFLI